MRGEANNMGSISFEVKDVLHTHKRADNDDEIKYIPCLLEVV